MASRGNKQRGKSQKEAPSEAVPGGKKPLTPRQERFCRYYTQNSETFGIAALSYAEAYGYKLHTLSREPVYTEDFDEDGEKVIAEPSPYAKAYSICGSEGHRLLKNPKIQERCRELLHEMLRDEVVDAETAKVIMQDRDLTNKIAAVREYNKVRGRIIDKTKIIHDKFAPDDIRTLLSVLPQKRQDEVYAILTAALAEAELLRGGAKA